MSPRFVPASVTELARVGLLAELPGERLHELAQRMTRDQFPAGSAIVTEGHTDRRFYVLLSGLAGVSQESLGPRRVLRPGDYFGEVAAALDIPRTASVRAMTPVTVASCDEHTFDEFIRPLFADSPQA